MTRMHFTRLAWELRQSNPRVEAIHDPASDTYFWRMRQWENDVTAIAAACAASNPRFNRDRFERACGLQVRPDGSFYRFSAASVR